MGTSVTPPQSQPAKPPRWRPSGWRWWLVAILLALPAPFLPWLAGLACITAFVVLVGFLIFTRHEEQ